MADDRVVSYGYFYDAVLMAEVMQRGATLSDDAVYRYDLFRRWDDGGIVLWIMLNPSTADADIDDPTIRRCVGFSKSWLYGALAVVNLYALRATDPKALRRHERPIGPENAEHIEHWLDECDFAVAAWGAFDTGVARLNVERLAHSAGKKLYCLGTTKNGSPRHPLYVAGNQQRVPFGRYESQVPA